MIHYIGMDVSQKMTAICVVDAEGRGQWRGQCASTPEQIEQAVRHHAGDDVRTGIETGPMMPWLVHELRGHRGRPNARSCRNPPPTRVRAEPNGRARPRPAAKQRSACPRSLRPPACQHPEVRIPEWRHRRAEDPIAASTSSVFEESLFRLLRYRFLFFDNDYQQEWNAGFKASNIIMVSFHKQGIWSCRSSSGRWKSSTRS